jgi:hypothetical protein
MAMSAFVANAQNVVAGDVNNFQACREYLTAHPQDTIVGQPIKVVVDDPQKYGAQGVVAGDTLTRILVVYKGSDGRVKREPRDIKKVTAFTGTQVVADFQTVDAVDHAAARTQTAERLASGKKRDEFYYQSSQAGATDGKVVKTSADKYGWALQAEAGGRLGKDISGLTFAAGPSYSWSWGRVELMARVARTKYSYNAETPDAKYTAFGARIGGYLKVFSFDPDYKTWNVYLGAGAGWDYFITDSRATTYNSLLKSEGSDPYAFANLLVTKRFFATGNEIYLRAGWEQNPITIQNADKQRINCWMVTFGFNKGLLRHAVRTK